MNSFLKSKKDNNKYYLLAFAIIFVVLAIIGNLLPQDPLLEMRVGEEINISTDNYEDYLNVQFGYSWEYGTPYLVNLPGFNKWLVSRCDYLYVNVRHLDHRELTGPGNTDENRRWQVRISKLEFTTIDDLDWDPKFDPIVLDRLLTDNNTIAINPDTFVRLNSESIRYGSCTTEDHNRQTNRRVPSSKPDRYVVFDIKGTIKRVS